MGTDFTYQQFMMRRSRRVIANFDRISHRLSNSIHSYRNYDPIRYIVSYIEEFNSIKENIQDLILISKTKNSAIINDLSFKEQIDFLVGEIKHVQFLWDKWESSDQKKIESLISHWPENKVSKNSLINNLIDLKIKVHEILVLIQKLPKTFMTKELDKIITSAKDRVIKKIKELEGYITTLKSLNTTQLH